jgi:hypothetical protein
MKSNTYKPKLKRLRTEGQIRPKKGPLNALRTFDPDCVPHDNQEHKADFEKLLDQAIGKQLRPAGKS